MNMPSQPLLWQIHHLPNFMGAGAGRVYGFGEPAGRMGSGGSQGVWVREAGRMYGFGGRQDVLVRGVGIQVGMGHSILMTGVLLRTSQSMRDCR